MTGRSCEINKGWLVGLERIHLQEQGIIGVEGRAVSRGRPCQREKSQSVGHAVAIVVAVKHVGACHRRRCPGRPGRWATGCFRQGRACCGDSTASITAVIVAVGAARVAVPPLVLVNKAGHFDIVGDLVAVGVLFVRVRAQALLLNVGQRVAVIVGSGVGVGLRCPVIPTRVGDAGSWTSGECMEYWYCVPLRFASGIGILRE